MKNLKTLGTKAALAATSAMFALLAAIANPAAALTVFAASTTGGRRVAICSTP